MKESNLRFKPGDTVYWCFFLDSTRHNLPRFTWLVAKARIKKIVCRDFGSWKDYYYDADILSPLNVWYGNKLELVDSGRDNRLTKYAWSAKRRANSRNGKLKNGNKG